MSRFQIVLLFSKIQGYRLFQENIPLHFHSTANLLPSNLKKKESDFFSRARNFGQKRCCKEIFPSFRYSAVKLQQFGCEQSQNLLIGKLTLKNGRG